MIFNLPCNILYSIKALCGYYLSLFVLKAASESNE